MWSCCAALRADKATQGKAEGENNVRELLQVRFGEIHLKGQNRPYFMRMLVERVREAVKDVQGHM